MKKEKYCHSFWRRECINKNIHCHECDEYYTEKKPKKKNRKKQGF